MKQIRVFFHPLAVVGRGSETQLQLGENSNSLTSRVNIYSCVQFTCIRLITAPE